MKIDRKNIGDYYKKVNSKIDHFFGKGVTSKGLKRYLKLDSYGIKRFIEREELTDIEGIEKVIQDCVDDRVAIDESVMTYESFQSSFRKYSFDISQDIDQDIEKTIADLYRVSLGHVESESNHITLTGVKTKKDLYVFTPSKIKSILVEVCNKLYLDISQEEFKFPILGIEIDLKGKIDLETFVNNVYNDVSKKKEQVIEEMLSWETNSEYTFKIEKNGVFIFEKH